MLASFLEWAVTRRELGIVFFDIKIPADHVDLLPALLERVDALVEQLNPKFRIVLECAASKVATELMRLAPYFHHTIDVEPPAGAVFRSERWSAVREAIPSRHAAEAAQHYPLAVSYARADRRHRPRADERAQRHNDSAPAVPVDGVCSFTINTEARAVNAYAEFARAIARPRAAAASRASASSASMPRMTRPRRCSAIVMAS